MGIPVSAALAALLGLLLAGLAMRVSQLRMRHKVSLGDGGQRDLLRAIRAHANTVEHGPITLLLVLACELTSGTTQFLAVMAGVFALSRLMVAAGLLSSAFHVLRMIGAGVTLAVQVVLATALLMSLAGIGA